MSRVTLPLVYHYFLIIVIIIEVQLSSVSLCLLGEAWNDGFCLTDEISPKLDRAHSLPVTFNYFNALNFFRASLGYEINFTATDLVELTGRGLDLCLDLHLGNLSHYFCCV